MSERDESRYVAIGAGSPTAPDPDSVAADDGKLVQAVADFVDDIVEDVDEGAEPDPAE